MAASDITSVAFIYKKMYSDEQIGEQTAREHVLMSKAVKRKCRFGEDFNYIVRSGNPQGVSGTFTNAQSGATGSNGVKFSTEPVTKYGVITLDGPSMSRSRENKAAFMDLVMMETDGVLEEVGDSHAFDCYRQNGNRGQRASIATDTVTLSIPDDARNFKEDMTVIASTNADGSTPRAGSTTVVAVDEDAGTIELASAAAITGFVDTDYLFRAGDPGVCVDGLSALIPLATPSATLFRNVDRTPNPRRYAGVRISDTSPLPEENAGLLGVKIHQGGKRADMVFWNPITFWGVARRLNAKVEYDGGGGKADYGFQYITIATPAGNLKCYSDPDAPTNLQYAGKEGCFQIRHSEDKHIHLIRDDGRPSLRQTNADGLEVRVRSISQTAIPVPGEWGVASIA